MKSFTKYSAAAGALFAAFALTACGSSSSSSDDNTYSYKLTVDETKQEFIATSSDISENYCVMTETGVQWKSITFGAMEIRQKYLFVGDTLIMHRWDDEDLEYSNYGSVYVGGTAGNLYGTWTMLSQCEYRTSSGKISCDEDSERNYQVKLTISTNSLRVEETQTQAEDSEYTLDYANSMFRYGLFSFLLTGDGSTPEISEIFYTFEYDAMISTEQLAAMGITSTGLSTTGETLTLGQSSLSVKVKDYSYNEDVNVSATIEISSNGTTCTGTYEKIYEITKSLCKIENIEYFSTDYDYDNLGNKYYYVDRYEKYNEEEFDSCMDTIKQNLSGDINNLLQNNVYGYFKKAADKGDHQAFINKTIRMWKHLAD